MNKAAASDTLFFGLSGKFNRLQKMRWFHAVKCYPVAQHYEEELEEYLI